MNQIVILVISFLVSSCVCGGYNNSNNNIVPIIETLYFPSSFDTNNTVCKEDVELFVSSFKNNTLWAYKMWDSSAKLPVSLMEGSQYQLGSFDECLTIEHPFSSQYCLATIEIIMKDNEAFPNTLSPDQMPYTNLYTKLYQTNDPHLVNRNKLYWGLCLPASCTPRDIRRELEKYLNQNKNSNVRNYRVFLDITDCQNVKQYSENNFTSSDYLFCSIIGFFVIIVGISTLYDYKFISKNISDKSKKLTKLILCFSAKANFYELRKPENNNKLRILYGLKFFGMIIAIFTHTLSNLLIGPIFNYSDIEKISYYFYSIIAQRADILIDLFLLIGGLLNTYSFLTQSEKSSFNSLRAIILRYFRMVPSFAIITFFYSTLFYKIGSGPLWPRIMGLEKDYCQENWWTNLLLINNYLHVGNMCILQGWYLGLDFQLFICSLPLNHLIKKNNKTSWTIFISILCATILIPFLIVFVQGKDPIFYVYTDFFYTIRKLDYFRTIYIPAYTRMSSYLIGMIVGFIYYKLRNSDFKMTPIKSIPIFFLAVIIIGACMFTGLIFYNPNIPYSALNAALYASLHRPIFATAFGVLMFTINFGSIPHHLLTWNLTIPLSKLSFGAYLVHMIFQLTYLASQRNPTSISIYNLARNLTSDVTLSLFLAFLLFIFIENPCVRFMKEIIPKIFQKS